ncbi:MAG: hypothetical protein ACFFD1_05100 [Candidatus Thorarchaeota archaeon]
MPKHFIGIDGYYEIYNRTSIIHQKINEGKTSYKYKIYNNSKNIPNSQDRWRIEQIMVESVNYKEVNKNNNKFN